MRQLYLTVICLLFSLFINAQNWQPFYANDEVHYTITDSGTLTNTIVVENTEVIGGDSVYHFNTIMDKCDTCVYFKDAVVLNAPDFLGYTMTFSGDGLYHFSGKTNFTIDATKGKGESWIFDVTNAISANVLLIKEEQVLGELDSVKYIYLTSGKGMRLSKNHGIIVFPYEIDGGDYEIYGIQNRGLGERVPKFKDFINYKTGDVLEYVQINSAFDGPVGNYNNKLMRYEIVDVKGEDNLYIYYNVKYTSVMEHFSYYWGKEEHSYTDYTSFNLVWAIDKGFYNDQITVLPVNSKVNLAYSLMASGIENNVNVDSDIYGILSVAKTNEGKYYKYIAGSSKNYLPTLGGPLEDTYNLDFDLRTGYYKSESNGIGAFWETGSDGYYVVYREDIGLISAYNPGWHTSYGISLLGARINGEVYGELGNIQFNTSVETINNANVTIYPNPATNQVTIQLEDYTAEAEVQLYNAAGQAVITQQHNFTSGNLTMDVTTLPKGIYYVKIETEGQVATKKLVIN